MSESGCARCLVIDATHLMHEFPDNLRRAEDRRRKPRSQTALPDTHHTATISSFLNTLAIDLDREYIVSTSL